MQDNKPNQTFKAKGHDAVLQRLQDNRSPVTVRTVTGQSHGGTIAARDRYTISLQLPNGGKRVVLFKSAIESFAF